MKMHARNRLLVRFVHIEAEKSQFFPHLNNFKLVYYRKKPVNLNRLGAKPCFSRIFNTSLPFSPLSVITVMGSCCSDDRSRGQPYPKAEPESQPIHQGNQHGERLKPLLQDFSIQYRQVTKLKETALQSLSIIEHTKSHIQRVLRRVTKNDTNTATGKAANSNFRTGILVLQGLDHPNVTRLYEAYEDANYFYMVYERVEGGTVLDNLSFSSNYTEHSICLIISQVLAGLSYCHSRGVVHKNLHVQNLLLLKHKGNQHVKIIGLESQGRFTAEQRLSIPRVFLPFAAPEMFNHVYTEKGDIWSCGVISYLLLSGDLPFEGNQLEQREGILSKEVAFPKDTWGNISAAGKDLVSAMLAKDPDARPTALQCLEMPWVLENSRTVSVESVEIPLRRLQHFNGNMQIKKTILVYVSKHLQGAGDIMLIEELFRNLDTNKDGKLSRAELISGYSQIMERDKATELVQSVMQTVDLDNSGFVDFSEFLFASSDPIFMFSNGNLRELFSLFDHDHDGTISLEEFERTLELSKASRSCWQEIIAQADVSGDGKLTLGEFSGLLKRAIGCDHRE